MEKECGEHPYLWVTNDSLILWPPSPMPRRKPYQLLLISLMALDMAKIRNFPSLHLDCSLDTPLAHLRSPSVQDASAS